METENKINDLAVSLYPYKLTKEKPKGYVARLLPSTKDSLTNEDVCRSIVRRRPTSLSEETLIHAVSAYFDELTHLLCNGHIIANGYFTAKAAIKGVFPYPVEHHDPDEHPIVIDFRQGVTLRKATRTVQVKIIGKIPQHAIGEVTDCTTGSVNRLLTPGGMLIVKGRKLKIMGDDPTVGMYFINDLTGERYRLPANRLAENRPARLVLGIPELPAGDYSLMVITQYVGRSTPARQPAEATLSHFVVPAATLPLSSTLTRPSQASRPARVRLPDPPESGSHARKRKKQ